VKRFFYLPRKNDQLPPVIILGHGLAAQKDFGLDKFAVKFTEAGYAVITFDYRSFGGSEGEPRNLVSPTRHLEDWDSAIEYVIKNLGDKVDVNNIALWGSSFSGGHVLVTAAKSARKDHIKAVISQVPYLSALSSVVSFAGAGITPLLKVSLFSLVDLVRGLMGLSRYYLPVVSANPEDYPLLSTPSAPTYLTIVPENPRGGWENKVPAEISVKLLFYNPKAFINDLNVPTLLVAEDGDDLCSVEDVREIYKKYPEKFTYVEFKGDHFGIYNQHFEKNVQSQIQFLQTIFQEK